MERATIELHDRREDAIASAEALREVGLATGDIGLIYLMQPGSDPVVSEQRDGQGSQDRRSLALVSVDVPGLGTAVLGGWLIETRPSESTCLSWLQGLLAPARRSNAELEGLVTTLRTGGGIVSIRSTDRDSTEPSIDEILLGRGT